MSRTKEELEQHLLTAKLSASQVKINPKGMSYVDGHYVDSMLNEIFGPLGWELQIDRLECTTGVYDDPNKQKAEKGQRRVGYLAVVTLTLRSELGYLRKQETGHGSGIGKDLAELHEAASKEAVTDAMKRAAKHLGPVLGLALYDKEQRDVEEVTKLHVQTALAPATREAYEEAKRLTLSMEDGEEKDACKAMVKALRDRLRESNTEKKES